MARARGDNRPDSDYDVAVFLNDLPDRGREMRRLAELETDILYDTGAVINALPFPADARRERTGFMHELRREPAASDTRPRIGKTPAGIEANDERRET